MVDIQIQEISQQYTRKDFVSDQTVRWCPGCGDYAILAAVQKVLPELGVPKEKIVFISGIGCSSRFPYYMNTYGIHSIHGRAPTLATGLKIASPDLQVWVVTGDGDGLSIGGNHLLHACRRNIDLNILLFNNRIYGLTKGQYSPTSPMGTKTKSSPMGTIEHGFNPVAVTLGAEATFIARTVDSNTQHMGEVLKQCALHKGTSFVEILQNCVIFNNDAWAHVEDKSYADDNSLFLENGQPMIFGKNHDRGIRLSASFQPEVVYLRDGITEDDLLVHDETNFTLAFMLAHMDYPQFPVPMGVIYRIAQPTYEQQLMAQIDRAQMEKGVGDLRSLYHADYTWTVKDDRVTTTVAEGDDEMASTGALDEAYIDTVITGMTDDAFDKIDETSPKSRMSESLVTDPIANLLPDRALIATGPGTSLADAIHLMQEASLDALLIVDDSNRPVGIFTETDILRKVATLVEDLSAHTVAEFMTRNPHVLRYSLPIANALNLMAVNRYRHIPVVNERDEALAIIAFRDVIHYIETHFDKPGGF